MWELRPWKKEKEQDMLWVGQKPLMARLLAQRNIELDSLYPFISASYKDICHPYDLRGIEEASKLFCDVALKKGKIQVLSDYDCDGVISAVMVKELCNIFGLDCKVFLPSRTLHGYGLNPKSIASVKEKFKTPPDLLFVLDSGSSSENEIQELKKWGTKHILIFDHHYIDSNKISKSADVLVNWHLYDFEETCTCGELFHFIRGIRWLTKKVNPQEFIAYAALGILADVAPIIGNNRIIVRNGLKKQSLNNIIAAGLNSLIRKSNIYTDNLTQEDALFRIAPKINAAGRIKSPNLAYNLLIEQDRIQSDLMAENLGELNDERKKIQKQMEKDAIKHVEKNIDKYQHGIVLFYPEWSGGIVGIVASKLVEKFFKPSIIVVQQGDVVKGSGRSLEPINLKEILDDCKDMFIAYGGHMLAGGVTLKPECVNEINNVFNGACEKYYKEHGKPKEIRYYDAELRPKQMCSRMIRVLVDTLYPYCSQFNPEPIFKVSDATIVNINLKEPDADNKKIRWRMMTFGVTKDDKEAELKMKIFTDDLGTEIEGMKADIYFSFPQVIPPKYPPLLNVVDIEFKK